MPLSSEILSWNDQLKTQYANFFSTAQEVVDYMQTEHAGITTKFTPGTRNNERVFDSTAPDAVFLLASFLSGALFSEADQWFDIRHGIELLNQDRDAADYFQGVRQVQLASLRQSNYYATTIEFLTDWLLFGNMCLLQEKLELKPPNYPRLVFTPVGFGSYVFFEGEDKRPEGLIRELDMYASECMKKFGDNCSEVIKAAAEKTPFRQFRIVHSITPRSLINYKKLATPKEMPWASCWFEAGKKNQKPLLESGYKEKPFAIARYNVIAGEVMGRGLGNIALPHVKTLNRIIARGFLDLDKSLDPPTDTTPGNIIGSYSHKAGAMNVVKNLDKTQPSKGSELARTRNATYEWNVNDLREAIERIFFSRNIRELMGTLANEAKREQTAYEYGKKLELVHLVMAPTGGRLQSEALRDIIETNYAINYRTNALPPLPDVLMEAAKTQQGNQTVITYEGPLAQSQRNQQLGTMREYLTSVAGAAQLDPSAVDVPKIVEFLRKEAEIRGIQYLLNDEAEFNQIKQLKSQVAQLQAALQTAQQVSEVAKNMAPMAAVMQNGQQNGKAAAQA
jgi:Bacteriophage head to tail connecting protein